MSRYSKLLKNGKEIAWGFDHALGYFFQVFDVPDEDGEDVLLVDRSSWQGMSNGEMLELCDTYGVPESHIEAVAMDLPIE